MAGRLLSIRTDLGGFTTPKAKNFTGEEIERLHSLEVRVHEGCGIGSLVYSNLSFCWISLYCYGNWQPQIDTLH